MPLRCAKAKLKAMKIREVAFTSVSEMAFRLPKPPSSRHRSASSVSHPIN